LEETCLDRIEDRDNQGVEATRKSMAAEAAVLSRRVPVTATTTNSVANINNMAANPAGEIGRARKTGGNRPGVPEPVRGAITDRNMIREAALEDSQQYGTSQGSFAGRGPQGYKRSDERITEDINEELTQDADIDASNISVEVQNGEVTLKGTVPDRETKRRSEDIAESCSGVREVQNQLRVKREGESESEARKEKGDDKRSHRQQLAS